MRLTRHHLYLLVGLVVLIVGPAVFSQPDPSQWGGRSGGKMRRQIDPDAQWNQYSQGKETFNINNVQFSGWQAMMADRIRGGWKTFLESKGINDGHMTRALFDEYQQEVRNKMQKAGFVPGAFKGGPGKGGDTNAPAVDPKAEDAKIDEEAKARFALFDQNKDNFIDREEARFAAGTLRDFDRHDTNHDGKISLEEFIEAYREEQAQFGRGSRAANNGAIIQPGEDMEEEDKRPVVYRAGKLPKELPSWFAELDKDKDGQVGLYEWKAGGKPTSEFVEMDANGDGFLTVEEVLRHQKATGKDKQSPGINAVAGGPNGMPWGGMPGGGMMGGGRFGQMGWGGAMPGGGWGRGPGMGRGDRGMRGPGGGQGGGRRGRGGWGGRGSDQ